MSSPPADDDARDPADDSDLFRLAVGAIRRAPPSPRVSERAPPPAPLPRQRDADELAVLREMFDDPDPELMESGDTLSYRMTGVQDGVLRKLRRGHYRIEAELDLHGYNREQAKLAVARFLALCHDQRRRCVRIIHGKGNGSPNTGPVLKQALAGWLRKRQDVLAYCSARPVDGGTGAIYLLLRGS